MRKKVLLLAIFVSALGLYSCSENESVLTDMENQLISKATDWPKVKEVGVKTTWTIGRKSRGCRGLGICKLKKVVPYIKFKSGDGLFQKSSGEEREIETGISVSPISDQFSLLVDEENLERARDYFGGDQLILEEDYFIDEEESAELGLKNPFLIRAGVYDFVFDEGTGYHEIIFTNAL